MSLGSASSASPRRLTHALSGVYLPSLRFLALTEAREAPVVPSHVEIEEYSFRYWFSRLSGSGLSFQMDLNVSSTCRS